MNNIKYANYIIGAILILMGLFITPSFVANHFSPDGILEKSTIITIQLGRILLALVGLIAILSLRLETRLRKPQIVIVILISILLLVVLKNAWVGDDSYISFRIVDNFVHGYGLTWNTDERVQAYTNPLWVLCLSPFYFITGEIYYTCIALSILVTLTALLLVFTKICVNYRMAAILLTLLLFSRAFVDYSTSGLENPLSNLILALFFVIYFHSERFSPRRIGLLSFIAAMGLVNRMDFITLLLPSIIAALIFFRDYDTKLKEAIQYFLIGLAPFILWCGFSLIYYGFVFPNTFYAKLGTGISEWVYAQKGVFYLQNALLLDPVTFLTIVAALLFTFTMWKYKNLPPAIGILLTLFYVVYIGGDFMSGRLLTAPLFLSVIILSRIEIKALSNNIISILIVIIIFTGLLVPGNPVITDYSQPWNYVNNPPWNYVNGISDEKGGYIQWTGLLNSYQYEEMPGHKWAIQGRELRKIEDKKVLLAGGIGFLGYFAGPRHHIIDYLGLADPLLARLPAKDTKNLLIGHVSRSIPDGYIQSIENDSNLITDPNISKYYEVLRLITRGPIFDYARLRAIWDINTGAIALVESFALETNTDRPGMDYCNFDLASANPSLCEQACNGDPNCLAFTYVKPGVQDTCARCYLKNGIPIAYPATCCDSGVKTLVLKAQPMASRVLS